MPNPTMQQIAHELGLSRWTVSCVVNRCGRARGVAAETVQRVEAYMRERGYAPSRSARELRDCERPSVGILQAGRLFGPWTDGFLRLTDALSRMPRVVEIIKVAPDELAQGARELLARRVSCAVWIHTRPSEHELADPTVLNYLRNIETVILYNYHFGRRGLDETAVPEPFYRVGYDRSSMARRVAEFLAGLGHRRILFPHVIEGANNYYDEEKFYRQAGLEIHYSSETWEGRLPDSAIAQIYVRSIREAMRQGVTSVYLPDDSEAAYTVNELVRQGVRIPEELTVISHGGLMAAEICAVPLTTIRVPVQAMDECVQDILTKKPAKREYVLEAELVERASHAPVGPVGITGTRKDISK